MSFTANSNTTTLTFRDLSTASDSINLTLDNVRVTIGAALAPALALAESPVESAAALAPDHVPLGYPSLSGNPGNFTIRMTAATAGSYVLERSGDLMTWERISTMQVADPGPIEFHDNDQSDLSDPPAARRFYRIGLLPDGGRN